MKRILVFLKSNFWFLLIILVTFVLLLPQLRVPWMLVDDGETLRMAKEFSQHFSSGDFSYPFHFEAHNGRFRPVYWLFQWLTVSTLGPNPFVHHFGHLVMYALISAILYLIVNHLAKSSLAAVLSCLLFLAWGKGAENIYRVGPIEPQLVLYLLTTFYFLIKGNLFLSLITLPLVYFSKESAIVLVVISAFIFFLTFFQKNKKIGSLSLKKAGIFMLGNIILAIFVRLLMNYFNIHGGYSTGYIFSLNQIKGGMLSYFGMVNDNYGPIFIVSIVLVVLRLCIAYLKKNFSDPLLAWEAIFLFWFFVFILLQSPWVFIMGRYLPPALIGLCFVMGVESANILVFVGKQLKSRNAFYKAGLSLVCLAFLLRALVPSYQEIFSLQKRAVASEFANSQAVAFLAKNTPKNGRVFYNFSDGAVEFLYEMGVHFEVLYDRKDIETSYLYLETDSEFKKGDIIVSWLPNFWRYPWEEVVSHLENLEKIGESTNEWQFMIFNKDTSVGPLLSIQTVKKQGKSDIFNFSFADGQKPFPLPLEQEALAKGKIMLQWQPPKDFSNNKRKISLIFQDDKTPLLWVDNNKLFFGIFDKRRDRWHTVSIRSDLSSYKNYQIFLEWGNQGMKLSLGNVLRFYPYYQGLEKSTKLFLGPAPLTDFSEKSGRIDDLEIFTEE